MRFKNRGTIIAVSAAITIGAIFGVKYLVDVKKYKEDIAKIEIKDIDISKIKDGVYTGEFDANFIAAKVEVKIEGKKIKSITLIEHKNERGQAAENIINDVMQKNTIKVDTVAGATNSSKVILKSIEQALEE